MFCRKQNRMTLIASLVALAFVVGSPLAFAQDKAEGKKPSGGGAMPAPPAELAKLNSMGGNWKCSSKMHLPSEMGGEQTGSSTMMIKKDMGGYWLVGQWKMAKTKTMPEMKGTIYWGYDPAEKNF